jgi:hypothetical protein
MVPKASNNMKEGRNENPVGGTPGSAKQSVVRLAFVIGGVVLGQMLLYGPSLVGSKLLLPLDYLALPGVYLPPTEGQGIVPHDFVLSDLAVLCEPSRQFAVSEIHAGRWPIWTPYQFAGSPFAGYPRYSPFGLLGCCVASPVILAWAQLLLAVSVGVGTYLFCRRVLDVGPWPAILAAWCWPLCGYFVFWQGYGAPLVVGWLPWILWAVNATVRQTSRWAGAGLAATTCLVLTGGQLDVSGQALLASGLFAVWCFIDEYGKKIFTRCVLPGLITVIAGWMFGFMLAAPYWLPLVTYSRTGARMERRNLGEEERPPIGLAALPQTVLPDMYGSTRDGSLPIFPKGQGNQLESSAATYTGLLATLLLAPLAWCSRRHRSMNVFWIILGFLGLSWCLDVPGIVPLLRWTPGLKMMSHNRFVFATSLAVLAMMAIGLDVLWQSNVRWRLWFWVPVAVLTMLLLWCGGMLAGPGDIASRLAHAVDRDDFVRAIPDLPAVTRARAQATFVHFYAAAALLCALGIVGWLLVGLRVKWRPWLRCTLVACLFADLLWSAYGRSAQCNPALYYPRIPVLEELAKAPPGRVIGFSCLPAILAQTHGLRDIRGYDAVDPARLIDLLVGRPAENPREPALIMAADPRFPLVPYALTQRLTPRINVTPPDLIQLSPVLDMLNVRYVIFRGSPWELVRPGSPPQRLRPDFSSPDYWVLINGNALPRAFVPMQVETVARDKDRLKKMAAADFNPRQTAYVEQAVELPGACRGSAQIVAEIPTRVTIACEMETRGLVVLADLWDKGWNAYWEGKAVPILRTNHAVRGVVVPAGKGTLEFRYEPASFAWGWRLCGLALIVLLGWAWWGRRGTASRPALAVQLTAGARR